MTLLYRPCKRLREGYAGCDSEDASHRNPNGEVDLQS
jgi:hypothetical protein